MLLYTFSNSLDLPIMLEAVFEKSAQCPALPRLWYQVRMLLYRPYSLQTAGSGNR